MTDRRTNNSDLHDEIVAAAFALTATAIQKTRNARITNVGIKKLTPKKKRGTE